MRYHVGRYLIEAGLLDPQASRVAKDAHGAVVGAPAEAFVASVVLHEHETEPLGVHRGRNRLPRSLPLPREGTERVRDLVQIEGVGASLESL